MVDGLTVYVDDSGSDTKSKVAAAAFCVSSVDRWQSLLNRWRDIASSAGFDLKDFHMTEFVACRRGEPCQQCQYGSKPVNHPWKNWSNDKRKKVLTQMAKAIVKHVEFGVGHAFTKTDYDEHVLHSPARSVANEPITEDYFTFAVQRCGGSLAEWRAAKSRFVPLKFVFDTTTNKTKKEIADVFFGAANDRAQNANGIEQWFNPEEGVSYESRKQVHQLLTADMLAWTVATLRAREMFNSGRNQELIWVAEIFVETKNVRLGYMNKDALARWEKDKLNEVANSKSGISEFRPDNEGTTEGPPRGDQNEAGSGEESQKAEEI